MKYKILKAFIVFENGQKDIMENEYETNDIEAERKRLISEFNCKTVYFTFAEQPVNENAIKI